MSESQDGMATSDTFAEALARLKQEGSMLLTTGAGEGPLRAACRRLTGDDVTNPRKRLFVLTGHVDTDHAAAGPSKSGRIVRYDTSTRSVAAESASETGPAIETTTEGLDELYTVVSEEVAQVGDAKRGFDPAELRICVDSLDDLMAEHGREEAFGFLHELGELVRRESAMCHVHLPAAMDDQVTGLVGPLFDAVIEVRSGPQQRWHLRDPDLTTDWLSLE